MTYRKVFCRNVLEQFVAVVCAKKVDTCECACGDDWLDDAPEEGEDGGDIDDEGVAKGLTMVWVRRMEDGEGKNGNIGEIEI